jgi:hypothetical protein
MMETFAVVKHCLTKATLTFRGNVDRVADGLINGPHTLTIEALA